MKKTYTTPSVEITKVELCNIIALSSTDVPGLDVDKGNYSGEEADARQDWGNIWED